MNKKIQCEGYVKRGNFMTFGPVRWIQCKNDAIVTVTVVQEGKTETFPACKECWARCKSFGIELIEVMPIEEE